MNPEIKAQWIAALKSGEFKQDKSSLNPRLNSYCCLGVLCALYQKKFPNTQTWGPEDPYLPQEIVKWANLQNVNPVVNGYTLSYWNDVLDADFIQIAELIEKNL